MPRRSWPEAYAGVVIGVVGHDPARVGHLRGQAAQIVDGVGDAAVGAGAALDVAKAVADVGGREAARVGVGGGFALRIERIVDLRRALVGLADQALQAIVGIGIEAAARIGDAGQQGRFVIGVDGVLRVGADVAQQAAA